MGSPFKAQPGQFSVFDHPFWEGHQVGVIHKLGYSRKPIDSTADGIVYKKHHQHLLSSGWFFLTVYMGLWLSKKGISLRSLTSMLNHYLLCRNVQFCGVHCGHNIFRTSPNPSNLGAAKKDRKFRLEDRPRCRSASHATVLERAAVFSATSGFKKDCDLAHWWFQHVSTHPDSDPVSEVVGN